MRNIIFIGLICSTLIPTNAKSQIDNEQLGAWYMYFFSKQFQGSVFGFQGDIQYRNWNIAGDLEQLLIRTGATYKPDGTQIKFTLGYGNITTGTFGDVKSTTLESRIYQEAIFPVKFGNRFYTTHRFRYEQRFVENQNFRTRYRYNLFLNIALSKPNMEPKTLYLALYNELFINGQRNIGENKSVEIFDRNRFYTALGYVISKGLKIQAGLMNQSTNNWKKNQLQISLHHNF